ncbi:MAG: DUF5919 domain-containing protein [Candidatus Hodarchaeota archaeon]
MKNKTKEFLRSFLSLRNIVPIIVIVGAFIGTFVDAPFGLNRDQLILGLLAFIAIDAIIERLELLTNIEKDLGTVKDLVESRITDKDYLKRRREFPRLEHMISDAKQEIWISGIILDTMVTCTGIFYSKLSEGFRLRFLAISQEESTIEDTSRYSGVDSHELRGRLKANLITLYKRLVQMYPQQVEIRTISHRPALGYFIVDQNLDQGYMTIFPYLYKAEGSDKTPLILLSKKTDSNRFEVYLKDFESLWDNAKKWEFNSQNHH